MVRNVKNECSGNHSLFELLPALDSLTLELISLRMDYDCEKEMWKQLYDELKKENEEVLKKVEELETKLEEKVEEIDGANCDEIIVIDDENHDVNDRVDQNAIVRQHDIQNGNEPILDPCDMSTYKTFHYIQLVLYVIVAVLMSMSLVDYVDLGIFNGDGYNLFLLIVGAIGSLFGTILPTYLRKKFHRRVYSESWKGCAWRVALMVLDIVLFVVTTVGAVRLVRSLKGRASLLPLGLNLAATIVLRITQLSDVDNGYTDMLVALFVGKIDEEYKHFRHRDLLVNIFAIGWISFRLIGMLVMRESKSDNKVKINTIIMEMKGKLELILEGRLTNTEENRQTLRLMLQSLYKLEKRVKED